MHWGHLYDELWDLWDGWIDMPLCVVMEKPYRTAPRPYTMYPHNVIADGIDKNYGERIVWYTQKH